MALKLMFITNDTELAVEAEKAGIDRIFIDLEIRGKEERQGHLDTVISRHSFADIAKIKKCLSKSKLLVRINPFYYGTKEEVDEVIRDGADIVMLPMFSTKEEVEKFVEYVDNRAEVSLLLETPQAMVRLHEIVKVKGIDEIHIGLNDLHLGLGLDFMFELLSGGIVEYISSIIKKENIRFGFGGIARVGEGTLSSESIICEHERLGSEIVILSRTFHNRARNVDDLSKSMNLHEEIMKIREAEKKTSNYSKEEFNININKVRESVQQIVYKIEESKKCNQ